MRKPSVAIALSVAVAAVTFAAVADARADANAPVKKIRIAPFGDVLTTAKRHALYYWNVEKRDFKVHCTGACAQAWPPLLVRTASAVPKRIAGIRGTFGTIRRPDGKVQVTWNRLPIYTYAHEGPGRVLCDNVDGWFVVRV
jgi:predicted lipoprotein with Yx(FWY)xxD motif